MPSLARGRLGQQLEFMLIVLGERDLIERQRSEVLEQAPQILDRQPVRGPLGVRLGRG